MAEKPNPEHQSSEIEERPVEEPLVIEDMGAASDKTKGCCGLHSEIGFPPYNNHQ